jgi:hypothetical protein
MHVCIFSIYLLPCILHRQIHRHRHKLIIKSNQNELILILIPCLCGKKLEKSLTCKLMLTRFQKRGRISSVTMVGYKKDVHNRLTQHEHRMRRYPVLVCISNKTHIQFFIPYILVHWWCIKIDRRLDHLVASSM